VIELAVVLTRTGGPMTVENRLAPARENDASQTAAVVVIRPELLCQLSYRSMRCSGRDSNPRPVDEDSITGTVPARSRTYVAVMKCGRLRSRTAAAPKCTLSPDNRAAPARDDRVGAGLPGLEPGPTRLELVVLPFTPQACKADDPDRTGLSGVALRCSPV
jgi:hypothetical protein